jgi:hypothetical protein
MCIRGLTQPSSRTTGPACNVPEPAAANPGITEEQRRTIVEMMAEGTNAGSNRSSRLRVPTGS